VAAEDRKETAHEVEQPRGTRPNRKPDDKENRKQGGGDEASAGGPPIDPADEDFIESAK
jgi:hypothetical protein